MYDDLDEAVQEQLSLQSFEVEMVLAHAHCNINTLTIGQIRCEGLRGIYLRETHHAVKGQLWAYVRHQCIQHINSL